VKLFFDDVEMDAQLQRTVIAANAGAADIGEALATAARITPGDYDSWFTEWSAAAERAGSSAAGSRATGHRESARKAFLRASEYWRQSWFFLRHDVTDERLQRGWRAHRAAFRSATSLFPGSVVIDEIPYPDQSGASMTAYLFRATDRADDVSPRPVVLAPCGYDSTAEAGYPATAHMAVSRGYDCLVWEGPGQGGMLYEHGVPMRPDFEIVLRLAVDWLVAQPGVDGSRLGMVGRSFAGYLAPRGASGDDRIAALVCDPGQYDFVSRLVGKMFDEDYWKRIQAREPAVDAELQGLLDGPHQTEWFGARMATMGAATVGDFLRMQPGYSLEGRLEMLSCPVLVTEGEGDFAAQTDGFLSHLPPGAATVHRFAEADGAGGHCEGLGATLFEEVCFDWLDDALDRHDDPVV
jgi:hypothetical protein